LLRDLRPYLSTFTGRATSRRSSIPKHISKYSTLSQATARCEKSLRRTSVGIAVRRELDSLRHDEAEKFQLVDTLKFQIGELERAQLSPGEDEKLEEERRRLANVEKADDALPVELQPDL
jgi:DNA repair protein RecN (Recombination protein N)